MARKLQCCQVSSTRQRDEQERQRESEREVDGDKASFANSAKRQSDKSHSEEIKRTDD